MNTIIPGVSYSLEEQLRMLGAYILQEKEWLERYGNRPHANQEFVEQKIQKLQILGMLHQSLAQFRYLGIWQQVEAEIAYAKGCPNIGQCVLYLPIHEGKQEIYLIDFSARL